MSFIRLSRWEVRVGFSYLVLYQAGVTAGSRYSSLFTAASVFIGPAVLTSLLSMLWKIRLIVRATKHRQATAEQRKTHSKSRRNLTHMSLRNLAELFVLRRDQHAHNDSKRANDLSRYEGFGYMLGLISEA
jgi:hypothetical protein